MADSQTETNKGQQKEQEQGYLVVEHVVKTYGKLNAADDVSFTVGKGEMVTLLGPSGCGKSTTLRCVAGLETIDGGQIIMDGVTAADRRRAEEWRRAELEEIAASERRRALDLCRATAPTGARHWEFVHACYGQRR
jgi:ABC-type glutathione transport system ATPase component